MTYTDGLRQRLTTDLVSFIEVYLRQEVSDAAIDLHPIHVAMCDLIDYAWQRGLTPTIVAPYEHAKSTIARAAMLWAIVHDQRLRLRYVSASKELAKRSTSLIRDVLSSARFRSDFPQVVPARPWTPGEITLERASESADPTLVATGIDTKTTGVRVDLMVLDDMESELSTYSEAERAKVLFAYRGRLRHRLASGHGRALIIATRQAPDDVIGQILRDPGQLRTHAVMVLSIPTTGPQRASRIDCRLILPRPHGGLVHPFGWATRRPEPVPDLSHEYSGDVEASHAS